MWRIVVLTLLAVCCVPGSLLADPPAEINYQGVILANGTPYTGTGYFKFALSSTSGTVNYWANDGAASGEPSGAVAMDVSQGVYAVTLGGGGMTPIDRLIFGNGDDLYLRVWFSEDNVNFEELLPAQRMVSHGYAVNADQVDGLDAAEIVAAASSNVTLAGDVTGPAAAAQIAAGAIVDADIHAAASISPSKVAGTALTQGSNFSGDVSGTFGNLQIGSSTVGAAEISDDSIADADVAAAAAIQGSKITSATTAAAGVVQIAGGSGAAAPFHVLDDSDTRLHAFGTVNTLTASAPNSVLSVVGADGIEVTSTPPGTLQLSATPPPVLANTIYAALNGTPLGPGTMEQPFDTAQAGYDAAAAAWPGVMSAVVLMGGGSYGPLSMHAGTVHVLGLSRSELGSLTVTAGIPSPPFPGAVVSSKQRVENIVVTGPTTVPPNGFGAWVKFHNCRFLDGLDIDESYVEVRHSAVQRQDLSSPAVTVGMGGAPITEIGFYQSSLLSVDSSVAPGAVQGTLTVGAAVRDFEVIGCQIVNEGSASGGTGPAIMDLSPGIPPPQPLHLYSRNVIKGPPTGTGLPAVADSILGTPPPGAPTIVFTHNTVYGDVGGTGGVMLPAGAPQFFANNTIYGTINFGTPPAQVGWVQAGGGPGIDGAGNTEHPAGWGPGGFALPSHQDD